MNHKTILPAVLLLAALPVSAQKVYIDYDPTYDRSDVETFAWLKTEDTSVAGKNGLMHSRIVNAMEHYLSQGGLREVEKDPDVYVTYHTDAEEEVAFDTMNWGYGYPGSWSWDPYWSGYWGGGMGSTTTVRQYTQGTLIIDIWDAETKKMIWRGSASAVVPEKPAKIEKKIYKALEKMAKQWRKIQRKEGG